MVDEKLVESTHLIDLFIIIIHAETYLVEVDVVLSNTREW